MGFRIARVMYSPPQVALYHSTCWPAPQGDAGLDSLPACGSGRSGRWDEKGLYPSSGFLGTALPPLLHSW